MRQHLALVRDDTPPPAPPVRGKPCQLVFTAFFAFYAPTCEPRKRRRIPRRRCAYVQMLLPQRKTRRRLKPFCLGTAKLSPAELRESKRLKSLPVLVEQRPKFRHECKDGPRPCPWVSCRAHLYLDVNPKNGSIKLNFPGVALEQMEETCSWDVAERGGVTLDRVGELMNITMERVRQIEVDLKAKLREALVWEDSDLYQ